MIALFQEARGVNGYSAMLRGFFSSMSKKKKLQEVTVASF